MVKGNLCRIIGIWHHFDSLHGHLWVLEPRSVSQWYQVWLLLRWQRLDRSRRLDIQFWHQSKYGVYLSWAKCLNTRDDGNFHYKRNKRIHYLVYLRCNSVRHPRCGNLDFCFCWGNQKYASQETSCCDFFFHPYNRFRVLYSLAHHGWNHALQTRGPYVHNLSLGFFSCRKLTRTAYRFWLVRQRSMYRYLESIWCLLYIGNRTRHLGKLYCLLWKMTITH